MMDHRSDRIGFTHRTPVGANNHSPQTHPGINTRAIATASHPDVLTGFIRCRIISPVIDHRAD